MADGDDEVPHGVVPAVESDPAAVANRREPWVDRLAAVLEEAAHSPRRLAELIGIS